MTKTDVRNLILSLFIGVLLSACAGTPKTPETITFEFVYDQSDSSPDDELSFSAIRISRQAGKDFEVIIGDQKGGYDHVEGITVKDLDGDGENEIAINAKRCAENCVVDFQIIYYDKKAERYAATEVLSRVASIVKKVQINEKGQSEFFTRNEEYTHSQGGTAEDMFIGPLQFFRFEDQTLVDVSRDYPEFVAEDAKYWLALIDVEYWLAISTDAEENFTQGYTGITGNDKQRLLGAPDYEDRVKDLFLTAYLADMYMIGQGDYGWEEFNSYCRYEYCQQRTPIKRVLEQYGYTSSDE